MIDNYATAPENSWPEGDTVDLPLTSCTPAGPAAWRLGGAGFTGYAERRGGVLLRLSLTEDDPPPTTDPTGDLPPSADATDVPPTTDPSRDLAAVARTLHPLGDHELWPRLDNGFSASWLLT
ncbi:hypothetical protein OG552_22580 [Streptomyces sp. NBC_01476]|uniref:hypothetical protein n=1 Tax=Streptomyces sp. NBC_01476 TaxID=2903881 RepID=UPI002E376BDB|nr:hypothetical protein [Streptomyces sp. NBC_01476]